MPTRPRAGQLNFDVTNISDPLLRFNSNETGTNTKDVGFVVERGSLTNTALIWDESTDQFAFVNTTEDGSTNGNVEITSYAGIHSGSITVNNAFTLPTTDGTNGQVIGTDGNGNLGFIDVATTLDEVTNNGNTTNNSISVGTITVSGNIVPSANETYSIGTPSLKFSEIYVSGSTIYLGDVPLSVIGNELYLDGNPVVANSDVWPGYDGNYDNAKALAQTDSETPFEEGGTDAFGVTLSLVFDNMSPDGNIVTYDYGAGEDYLGA